MVLPSCGGSECGPDADAVRSSIGPRFGPYRQAGSRWLTFHPTPTQLLNATTLATVVRISSRVPSSRRHHQTGGLPPTLMPVALVVWPGYGLYFVRVAHGYRSFALLSATRYRG